MTGTLTIAIDGERGILRVVGIGSWTPAQADDHFRELRRAAERLRENGGSLLVLVDLSTANVQSDATAARIRSHTDALYAPGDRIAVIVGSCLAKMQMRRTVDLSCHEIFISPNAAMTWLTAYSTKKILRMTFIVATECAKA